MTVKVELGQTVYIRAVNVLTSSEAESYEADVTYVGSTHFMAGDYTFRFVDTPVKIGDHKRASAYVSKATYLEWRENKKAWERLRYQVWANLNPPEHLTAAQIREIHQTIFPKG